jgi:transposase
MPFSKLHQDSANEARRLTDQEWSRVAHLFPTSNLRGRPRLDARPMLDAVLWVCTDENRWSRLPSAYPPQQTCYLHFLKWRRSGVLAQVATELDMPLEALCATTSAE